MHSTGELYDGNPIIIFIYEQTRGTDPLRKLLLEFHGYLTCDAYISYHVMKKESEGRITVTVMGSGTLIRVLQAIESLYERKTKMQTTSNIINKYNNTDFMSATGMWRLA